MSCKNGAITATDDGISIDRDKCKKCGACVSECPTEAMTFSGKAMTPEAVLKEVEKERAYIFNSGGGVTFSGGEPFSQPEFLCETAKLLKEAQYHVAIETCFNVPRGDIEACLPYLDLLLVDLKAVSSARHKKLTKMDNRAILENIRWVYGRVPFVFRIPIIPGQNDLPEEINRMLEFIGGLDPKARVDLLPYHVLGKVKYENLGRAYSLEDTIVPDKEYIENILQAFLGKGLDARII